MASRQPQPRWEEDLSSCGQSWMSTISWEKMSVWEDGTPALPTRAGRGDSLHKPWLQNTWGWGLSSPPKHQS